MVSLVEASLLQKGTREQNLLNNIRKGIDAILESSKKVAPEEIDFMDEEYQEVDDDALVEEIVLESACKDEEASKALN